MKFYKHWEIVTKMPEGYYLAPNAASPLRGYVFIIDKSPLQGGKFKLLKVEGINTNE